MPRAHQKEKYLKMTRTEAEPAPNPRDNGETAYQTAGRSPQEVPPGGHPAPPFSTRLAPLRAIDELGLSKVFTGRQVQL